MLAISEKHSLQNKLEELLSPYGIDHYSFVGVNRQILEKNVIVSTCDKTWVSTYEKNNYDKNDPRMKIAFKNFIPTVWEASQFKNATKKEREIINGCQDYGIGAGIIMPTHLSAHKKGFLNLTFKKCTFDSSRHMNLFNHSPMLSLYLSLYFDALMSKKSHTLSNIEEEIERWNKAQRKPTPPFLLSHQPSFFHCS